MPLVVRMLGRNAGEASDSVTCTAVNTTGAVRSAAAYQRPPTRQRPTRESRSRKPARPETTPVISSPAVVGPASIAATINGKRGSDCQVAADRPSSPPTAIKPPQEIANVSAK